VCVCVSCATSRIQKTKEQFNKFFCKSNSSHEFVTANNFHPSLTLVSLAWGLSLGKWPISGSTQVGCTLEY
jgi:hypothetical protein